MLVLLACEEPTDDVVTDGSTVSYGDLYVYASSIGGDFARDLDGLRIRSATPRMREPKVSLTLPWPRRCMLGDVVDARSMAWGKEHGAWDRSEALPLVVVPTAELLPSMAMLIISVLLRCARP